MIPSYSPPKQPYVPLPHNSIKVGSFYTFTWSLLNLPNRHTYHNHMKTSIYSHLRNDITTTTTTWKHQHILTYTLFTKALSWDTHLQIHQQLLTDICNLLHVAKDELQVNIRRWFLKIYLNIKCHIFMGGTWKVLSQGFKTHTHKDIYLTRDKTEKVISDGWLAENNMSHGWLTENNMSHKRK